VAWKSPQTGPHRGKSRYFDGLDFIAQLTLHIPEKGKHLVRRDGVYASRSRGAWKHRPALALRAAAGWYGREDEAVAEEAVTETGSVTKQASRKAWARLLGKVYEIDVLCCPKCGGRMSVVAVIRDPESIRKIVACMEKKGRGPPATAPNSKN
jgi:hypothetical protein